MTYILQHTRLGFCWLDLIALIVLIGVVAMFIVKRNKMKKEEKELQDQLSALYADGVVGAETEAKAKVQN